MKIFDLFGSIYVNTDEAEKSLSKTENGFEKVGKKFASVGGKVSKFGGKVASVGAGLTKTVTAGAAAIAGGVTAVTKFAETASSAADNIDKMSQRLGISRRAYQEFDFVLSQSGVDINSFQTGMKSLLKNMDAVTEGNKTAIENFEKLGVTIQKSDGSMKSQEEVLFETVRAFQAMEDSAEKSRLAQELFGKQGQEILPLLNSEAGSMDELMQKARDLGLVMSDDAIDAGVKLTDTMDQAKRALSTVGLSLGTELIPYVQKGAEYVIEHMPEIRAGAKSVAEVIGEIGTKVGGVIKWFSELDEGQQKTILKMAGIVAAAGPVLTIIGKVITVGGGLISGAGKLVTAIGGISNAAGLLSSGVGALPMLFNPVTLAIGLVVAAGVVLVKNWDSIKEAAGLLVERTQEHWENLKQGTKEKFDAVKEKMLEAIDKTGLDERFGAIKQAYEENGGGIAGIVAASQELQRQKWQAGYDAINTLTGGKLDEIKAKFDEKMGNAKDAVFLAIEKIKGFFDFEWKLPDIKLPHFSMDGSFSLNPPSVPKLSVDWYAKAMNSPMIMTKPTAFGINEDGEVMAGGETGSEVVSGTDTLMWMIRRAVSEAQGMSKEELYSVIVTAVAYVLQNYGMQLLIGLDMDKDELFKDIVLKNNEFKKMHGGKSALSDTVYT